VNAAGQVFISIGLAFGSVVSFSSYNKRENKLIVDTLTVTAINAFTSLLVAVFAFAVIGNIAYEHHTSVHDVITDGEYSPKHKAALDPLTVTPVSSLNGRCWLLVANIFILVIQVFKLLSLQQVYKYV